MKLGFSRCSSPRKLVSPKYAQSKNLRKFSIHELLSPYKTYFDQKGQNGQNNIFSELLLGYLRHRSKLEFRARFCKNGGKVYFWLIIITFWRNPKMSIQRKPQLCSRFQTIPRNGFWDLNLTNIRTGGQAKLWVPTAVRRSKNGKFIHPYISYKMELKNFPGIAGTKW